MSKLPTLEIGAGEHPDFDFDLHNDIRELPGIELVSNALELEGLVDLGGVSIVFANQFIEHLTEIEQMKFLDMCQWILPIGGMLLMWTPDRDWMEQARVSGGISEEWYQTLLSGKNDYPENVHKNILDREKMEAMLRQNNFAVHSIKSIDGSLQVIAFNGY